MISMMEVDDWLRAHTRVVNDGLVWPRGMKYSWETSRKIVHTYLSLGLDPSEAVTIDLVQALLQRIESLESAVKAMDRTGEACGACAHIRHPGRQCGAQVPTAEGRVCRCMAGLTTAEANAEIIKEGMARVRVGATDDMDLLQTYLEGGTEESQSAARTLDWRAVNAGRLSPAAYKAVWGVLPLPSEEGHRMWCGSKEHRYAVCERWGKV